MNKIILFILMFCSFSYVAAFDKVPITGLAAPSPDLISKNEFNGTPVEKSDTSDNATTTAMKEHDAFSFFGFKSLGIELFASSSALISSKVFLSNPVSSKVSLINDAGGLTSASDSGSNDTALTATLIKNIETTYFSFSYNTDEKSLKNDAIYYTSASNTDANDTALTATLIKNIETTYFSFAYNTNEKRLKNDAVGLTSVVTADKNYKTKDAATTATNNVKAAKNDIYAVNKEILSSFSNLIVTNDNAEIKNVAGKEIILVSISAYTSSVANIGNEHKPVAGSKIDTMAFGHSDYGA